jgi:ferritin-like metal-binding protein YciE
MTDKSVSIDDLARLGQQLGSAAPDMRPFVNRAVSELRSLRCQLAESDRLKTDLEAQLLGARQQIQRLQQLLEDQADRLERHRATDERIAGLADFAEWASESQYGGPPASVLVADLRRAIALEPFGSGSAA